MARVTTTLSVFLASPSDVEHERQIVAKVIDRWNHIRGREKSIYFDLIRWETSVSSGFGEDGQQVINQQIGEEYDLLIAMFWSRIGTSTVRSVSGTTEEYERALQRFRTDGSVDIAFYFKDAPIPMEHIIPEQIGGLRKLQLRLQDEGAFYKSFKDDDGLNFEIELLLDRVAREHVSTGRGHARTQQKEHPSQREVESSENGDTALLIVESDDVPDQRGLIDINEDIESHSAAAVKFMDELSNRLNGLSASTVYASNRITELSQFAPIHSNDARPIISAVSTSMDSFSKFLEEGAPGFSENSRSLAEDIRALIDVAHDFTPSKSEVDGLESMLLELTLSMDEAINGLSGLLGSTKELQRMTVDFNRAKRRLAGNLSSLIQSISSAKLIILEAAKEIVTLRST